MVTFEIVQMAGCDLSSNHRFDPQFCMFLLEKKHLETCRYIEMQKNGRPSIWLKPRFYCSTGCYKFVTLCWLKGTALSLAEFNKELVPEVWPVGQYAGPCGLLNGFVVAFGQRSVFGIRWKTVIVLCEAIHVLRALFRPFSSTWCFFRTPHQCQCGFVQRHRVRTDHIHF